MKASTGNPRGQERNNALGLGAVGALAIAAILWWNPTAGGPSLCPFYLLTGHFCPLCGGLRTVFDLAHGDLAGAWSMNPMLAIALPIVGIAWAVWLYRSQQGLPARQSPRWLFGALAVVVVAFAIVRNIPGIYPLLGPVS